MQISSSHLSLPERDWGGELGREQMLEGGNFEALILSLAELGSLQPDQLGTAAGEGKL